jgi:hypothetical protein
MTRYGALAFTVTHNDGTYSPGNMVSVTARIHGLLRIDADRLVIQWRLARETESYGKEMKTETEVLEVQEVEVALSAIATAVVRQPWPRWLRKPSIVLTAADLRAFETLIGAGGLERTHPAQLTLALRRADRLAAEEFVADLVLAIAERQLEGGRSSVTLPPGRE